MAEYSIEPWGEIRNDMMIAQLCYMLYSIVARKRSKKVKVTDFMPFFGQPASKRVARTPQQMETLLRQFAETYGQHSKPKR